MAIGCSMGGNLLANVMGAEGENSVVTAACIVEAPIKLNEVAENLAKKPMYDKKMVASMKKVIFREKEMMKKYF